MNILQRMMFRMRPKFPKMVSLYLDRNQMGKADRQELLDIDKLAEIKRQITNANSFFDFIGIAKKYFDIHQIDSEIAGLIEKVREYSPTVIGEIGTYKCGNLFLLTQAIPNVRKMIAIDLIFRHKGLFKALARPDLELGFFQGYSTSNSTYRMTRRFLGEDKFDLLFIDGDHTYEGVKSDFEKYRLLVKDGGLIVFHDVVPDLTTRMGSDVPLSKSYAGGVPIFWSEIKDKYQSYEFIDDAEQDGYGIGLIEYSVN